MNWKPLQVKFIEIQGIKQAIGVSPAIAPSAPVLLYVHGGPGGTMMPNAHLFQSDWDRFFTVVHWDQRGAGKTFKKNLFNLQKEDMTITQFIADTANVARFLKSEFNKEKIIILGHSWGSALATMTVAKHPELFHAYVGVGQVSNMPATERYIHDYLVEKAQGAKAINDIRKLERIGEPSKWTSFEQTYRNILSHRTMLHRYGGVYYNETSTRLSWQPILQSPDYGLLDKICYFGGLIFSGKTIGKEIIGIELDKTHLNFSIPMFYFLGRHDHVTPSGYASDYVKKIQAPHKDIVWFEQGCHAPQWSQKSDFLAALASKILPVASN